MPVRRKLGARVLKAVSSNLRLNILRLLFDRGPLSYTEIMNLLKLSPSKDAGRFAYHLKVLLNMDLIEPDVESKKYMLTDLGKSIVDFASHLEESAFKRRMLVRTSRLAIEFFDRNKIAESLVREAGVPLDLAQKIARETEERLLKLDTKYLTAPLIREFVNAILIERGLEEYRHKLTRLGLPVYDVTQLIKAMSAASANVEAIRIAAGNRVIEEYTLLNTLPRDIADAHLSGTLNLDNLACWILKMDSFIHDLRFFLRNGLAFKERASDYISVQPPKSFRAALHLVADILRLASTEVSCEQGIDFFNVFLAPFIKGLSKNEVKDELTFFLSSVNLSISTGVSLGLEMEIPGFLAECRAVGSNGVFAGVYGDYADESFTLASLILDCFKDICTSRPIFNPSPIIKVHPGTTCSSEGETLLSEAHALAVHGLPYFANIFSESQEKASYTAVGQTFSEGWRGDWELDIVRVGCMGSVTVNLPRAFYESKGGRKDFFENLYDFSEKALRALEIKYLTIKQRAHEGLMPFLFQGGGRRDPYCRLDNSLFLVSLVGLNETVQLATNSAIYEGEKPLKFAEELSSYLLKIASDHSRRKEMRCALSLTPDAEVSRRMASLDIERYGLAGVNISGSRERPYYSDISGIAGNSEVPIEKYLSVEERLHQFFYGSHLAKIPVREEDPEQLLLITKKIIGNLKIPLYTFDATLTYCNGCHKTFHGAQPKCPSCGSVNTIKFIRESTRYKAVFPSSK
ncbi:MAG: anaerobic ribonucleoside-triphosphate reductase [Candidatus Bathyarchaeia archaeon]|nr:anaerobic ribonucleoside-triphosphate reductase [Candidatus Bathyarchaeota archaeon]